MIKLNALIRASRLQKSIKDRLPKVSAVFGIRWRSPVDNYLIETQRQALENAFHALSMIEIDKDGDGYICKDAMPSVTRAMGAIRNIPDEFRIPAFLRRTVHAARGCCADASPQPCSETGTKGRA
jgi:hypothetical protein